MFASSSNREIRRAFTLIELLVVVAIIALLISILLPSLSRAREQARTVGCAANLKQFGTGLHMYADAADGKFVPIQNNGNPGRWHRNKMMRKIMGQDPNMGGGHSARGWDEGLHCPSFPRNHLECAWSNLDHGRVYGLNFSNIYDSDHTLWNSDTAIHRTSVQQPATKIQMTDANQPRLTWWGADPVNDWGLTHELHGNAGGVYGGTMYRHNEGANFLKFDGHVEYMSGDQAYPDVEEERARIWMVYSSGWIGNY